MTSVNFWWFMLSQTLFTVGSIVIMSILFELRLRRYIGIIIGLSIANSFINYLVYFSGATRVSSFVAIIGVLIPFLYLAIIVRVPVIWSLIATVFGGTILPLIIQLVIIFASFGFLSPEALKDHIWRNYALDITSGIVFGLVAFALYSQGWHFKFDFEKIRLKRERYIVIAISLFAALFFPVTLILTKFSLSLTLLSACSFIVFSFLLGYTIKKERDEMKSLSYHRGVK
ncbi:hypothetical protein [Priestia aryabhattai]|uniref:hypothetical protein n=1 Tax=Priestia aryabhattai TaxID=412384 RepID=UPI002E1CD23C|nr:hypothetical protein [Priestia aryabhattai]